jgi:uracil-DNA glycosylase
MSEATDQFLDAVRWYLESLRLAGVTRIPALLPQVAAAVAAPARTTTRGGKSASWAELAQMVKRQLGEKAGQGSAGERAAKPVAQTPTKAAPEKTPAPSADVTLQPSRPVDPEIEKQLADLAATVAKCTRCKDLAAGRTQTVFCDGPSNADLMFIGEAPGEDEDRQGVAFVGRAGKLLTKIIAGGMRMRRQDVYICNILKCRPQGNRNPNPDEAAACREYLDRQIDLVAPKVICLLGGIATKFLLEDTTPVGRMRGRWHAYRGIPVRVTYHPAYLLRSYTPDARQKVWDDVLEVVRKLKTPGDTPSGGPKEPDSELF